MIYKDFKNRANIEMLVPEEVLEIKGRGQNAKVKDPRTYMNKKGIYQVSPIALNDFSIFIVCPFCGNIHVHGQMEGYRTADCPTSNKPYYVISERKWLNANSQHSDSEK